MECEVCTKLLFKINDLDSQVSNAKRKEDFYAYRLHCIRFTSVVKSTKDMIQERYEQAWTNWICLKAKQ
jgi:hypothetical protein